MSARLAKIERKIEDAAKLLHPILLGYELTHQKAAHDALNALAAARLELGLLQMEADTEGATS